MKTKEEILDALRNAKSDLENHYHLRSIALFGSYSRGDYTEDSDVDLLVEFKQPVSGLQFVEFAEEIERCVGMPADVVPADGVKPRYFSVIEKELLYV